MADPVYVKKCGSCRGTGIDRQMRKLRSGATMRCTRCFGRGWLRRSAPFAVLEQAHGR